MKETVIYISSDEEITSVVTKVKHDPAEKIFLVVPAGAQFFGSLLNFKLLKHFSRAFGKNLVLVTSDSIARSLAASSELPALSKLEIKKNKADKAVAVMVSVVRKRISSEEAPERSDLPKFRMTDVLSKNKVPFEESKEAKASLENLKEKEPHIENVSVQKVPGLRFFRRLQPWKIGKMGKLMISLCGLSGLIILFVLFLVLPKAEITVYLQTTLFSYSTEMTVNSALAEETGANEIIGGKKYEQSLEKSFAFQSTGKHPIGEKAKGSVFLINKTWMTQPLVASTQLQSADGHIFRLDEYVILPPNSETKVTVTADQPGAAYNVGPGRFVIIKLWEGLHDLIYGETQEAMKGGTDVDQMFVTEADYKNSIEKAKADLLALARERMRSKIPGDKVLLDSALTIDLFEASPNVAQDAQVPEFTVSAKIKITGIAYVKKDYEELTQKQIKKLLSRDQDIIDSRLAVAKHEIVAIDSAAGVMKIKTLGEALIGRVLFEDVLKSKLVGKTTGDAESFLTSQPQVERVTINYWPFWVKRIPVQDGRIFLKAEYIRE